MRADLQRAMDVIHEQQREGIESLSNVAKHLPMVMLIGQVKHLRRVVRVMAWSLALTATSLVVHWMTHLL